MIFKKISLIFLTFICLSFGFDIYCTKVNLTNSTFLVNYGQNVYKHTNNTATVCLNEYGLFLSFIGFFFMLIYIYLSGKIIKKVKTDKKIAYFIIICLFIYLFLKFNSPLFIVNMSILVFYMPILIFYYPIMLVILIYYLNKSLKLKHPFLNTIVFIAYNFFDIILLTLFLIIFLIVDKINPFVIYFVIILGFLFFIKFYQKIVQLHKFIKKHFIYLYSISFMMFVGFIIFFYPTTLHLLKNLPVNTIIFMLFIFFGIFVYFILKPTINYIISKLFIDPIVNYVLKKYYFKNLSEKKKLPYSEDIKSRFSKYFDINDVYLANVSKIYIFKDNIYIPSDYLKIFNYDEILALIAREIYMRLQSEFSNKINKYILTLLIFTGILLILIIKNMIPDKLFFILLGLCWVFFSIKIDSVYDKYKDKLAPEIYLITPNDYYTIWGRWTISPAEKKPNSIKFNCLLNKEFYADVFAAILVGLDPTISALKKLKLLNDSSNSIIDPNFISLGFSLFDDSIEKRIERLKEKILKE